MTYLKTFGSLAFRLAVIYLLAAMMGCALSDAQIKAIADSVQQGTQAVVTPLVQVAAPGIDAGAAAGIASALGLGVAYLVKALLNLMQKKKTEE